ncbi:aromatic amino acid lyase [Streptomyces sp. NPDC002328]|uniref:aromatic amino acid lyase n=1 Tax=Streptomyces sp. NPDC002328 TaxID=3364642 RepID=UPI003691434D
MNTPAPGPAPVPRAPGAARILLTGSALTVGELIAFADGAAVPAVDPEARERAVRSWHTAQRLAAAGRLYGRGTGVGAHRSVTVDADDEAAHGLRLLRSHAGGAGALLPARQVRAMLAVRTNQLLAGGSGIHPSFIDALAEALELGVHPAVNEYGGIGTADLTALAQTALTLLGERPWTDERGALRGGRDGRGGDGGCPPGGGATGLADGPTSGRAALRGGGPDAERGAGPVTGWGDGAVGRQGGGSVGARGGGSVGPQGSGPVAGWGDGVVGGQGGGSVGGQGSGPVGARGGGSVGPLGSGPVGRSAGGVVGGGSDGLLDGRATAGLYDWLDSRPADERGGAAGGGLGRGVSASRLPAPVVLRPGDALALLSSNALALGQAALGGHALDVLLRATHAVAALSLAAVSGSAEAYAAPVHALRPYPGAAHAAAEVRRLLELPDGRPDLGPHAGPRVSHRIQDPFGFRVFPQVHGGALDAADRLRHVVEVEVNCPSENPVVLADADAAYHHGGFYAAPLGLALDGANLALLQTAQLSTARLTALGEPGLTGLPAFLAAGPASSSGTMILEYTANSALAELRSCATPATAGHAVLAHGLEEAASFAGQAARQALRATDAYVTVLACELVAAVRALRLHHPVPPAVPVFRVADAALPDGTDDRPLTGDVMAAAELLPRLAEL